MSIDCVKGYEIDETGLLTEEARRGFNIKCEEIELKAKAEKKKVLAEFKENEKEILARERADSIARALRNYEEVGLSREEAWELVKQEALMITCRGGYA